MGANDHLFCWVIPQQLWIVLAGKAWSLVNPDTNSPVKSSQTSIKNTNMQKTFQAIGQKIAVWMTWHISVLENPPLSSNWRGKTTQRKGPPVLRYSSIMVWKRPHLKVPSFHTFWLLPLRCPARPFSICGWLPSCFMILLCLPFIYKVAVWE